MTRVTTKLVVVLASLCVLAGAAFYFDRLVNHSVPGWRYYVPMSQEEGPAELATKDLFLSQSGSVQERYDALFRYFAAGALRYVSPLGAHIYYTGAGSFNGYQVTGLEGFARTGALLAAWIGSGRGDVVIDERHVDLVAFLRRGILAGTDPNSAEYWGRLRNGSQRILEAADIARILWITRREIWDRLTDADKARIADWLLQVKDVTLYDNNWLLAPVTVIVALRGLGWPVAFDETRLYDQFKRHYLGNGWFYDEPGRVDYYNVWGMTYELFWITAISEQFDRDFIRKAIRDSAALTSHLIGPQGFPVMGRSICYRTALPVPLIAQALLDPDPANAGLARRATEAIWRYFVAHGALQDGALTQGYFRSDLRLLDSYSGPGSCHWGLRSLVLALLSPSGNAFWVAPELPLPVEVADYRFELDRLGWIVEGHKASGEITIEIPSNKRGDIPVKPYGWWNALYEFVFQTAHRPSNVAAKYLRQRYSSAQPFWTE